VSARLIGELANWLLSPAAADVTPHERLVLFVIAERSHERTRLMLRHRGDDLQLVDRIAATTGLAREGALKKAFQKLERRGLEVRIPVKIGKNGRPVFTHEGHSMRFRLPEFPASVTIPERLDGPVDDASEPVDNPVDDGPEETPSDDERRDETSHHSARGETDRPASGGERRDESSRPYPSNYLSDPSNYSPSTSVRSPVAEEEGGPASADESAKIQMFDLRSALMTLLRLSPEMRAAATARAAAELGPDATNEALRIRTAEIASEGIPA
jgi:hypothetical protein